jgi:hypothetical protein
MQEDVGQEAHQDGNAEEPLATGFGQAFSVVEANDVQLSICQLSARIEQLEERAKQVSASFVMEAALRETAELRAHSMRAAERSYNEIVQAAEQEGERICHEAEQRAAEIIEHGHQRAEEIRQQAVERSQSVRQELDRIAQEFNAFLERVRERADHELERLEREPERPAAAVGFAAAENPFAPMPAPSEPAPMPQHEPAPEPVRSELPPQPLGPVALPEKKEGFRLPAWLPTE